MTGDGDPGERERPDGFGPFVEESWIVLTAARGVAQLENLLAACVVIDDRARDHPERADAPPGE